MCPHPRRLVHSSSRFPVPRAPHTLQPTHRIPSITPMPFIPYIPRHPPHTFLEIPETLHPDASRRSPVTNECSELGMQAM